MRTKTLAGATATLAALVLFSAVPAAADPAADPAEPVPADPGTTEPGTTGPGTIKAEAAAGVPHLSSPDNLPPGTGAVPAQPSGSGLGYLRDLWHAYQTQEVNGAGVLLLLSQRPMSNGARAPIPIGAPPEATPPEAPAPEAPAPPEPAAPEAAPQAPPAE